MNIPRQRAITAWENELFTRPARDAREVLIVVARNVPDIDESQEKRTLDRKTMFGIWQAKRCMLQAEGEARSGTGRLRRAHRYEPAVVTGEDGGGIALD